MNAPPASHPSADPGAPGRAHARITGVSVILEFVLESDRPMAERPGTSAADAGRLTVEPRR